LGRNTKRNMEKMRGNIKITREEISDHDKLLGHIVLHSIMKYPEVTEAVMKDGYAEVCMTVNGKEMYLKEFVDFWEGHVNRMIAEAAKELVRERMSGVSNLLYDLEERLKTEVEKRLEDWEKDD
jgi:hypothetical protein